MADCLFCQMAQKNFDVPMVYESNTVFVIYDRYPKAKVHLLAIPKKHLVTFNDLTPADAVLVTDLALAVKTVVAQAGIADSGYKVVINNGPDSGQAIPHLHWHILGGENVAGLT